MPNKKNGKTKKSKSKSKSSSTNNRRPQSANVAAKTTGTDDDEFDAILQEEASKVEASKVEATEPSQPPPPEPPTDTTVVDAAAEFIRQQELKADGERASGGWGDANKKKREKKKAQKHHPSLGGETMEACVKKISYYHGSKMSHKGMGFEGCEGLGDEFRDAYYSVRVEDEVTLIQKEIEDAVKRSLEKNDATPIIETSTFLIDSWNRYAVTNLNISPGCTLGKFWNNHDVRHPLLEAWKAVFLPLFCSHSLTQNNILWLYQNDENDEFEQWCLADPPEDETAGAILKRDLADSLNTYRTIKLLTMTGVSMRNFVNCIKGYPDREKQSVMRAMILNFPRELQEAQDKPRRLIGLSFRKLPSKKLYASSCGTLEGQIISVNKYKGVGGIRQNQHTWNIEWSAKYDDRKDEVVETQTYLTFEELLALAPNSSAADDDFLSLLVASLEDKDLGKQGGESEYVSHFVHLFCGDGTDDSAVADSTTAKRFVNHLSLCRSCRLMREIFHCVAESSSDCATVLMVASKNVQDPVIYIAAIMKGMWDEVVMSESGTGTELANAKRFMSKVLEAADTIDDIDKNDDDWPEDDSECGEMLEEIWDEVAAENWSRKDYDSDDESCASDGAYLGLDFAFKEEYYNYVRPIKSWFSIAGCAMERHFTLSEPEVSSESNQKVKKSETDEHTTPWETERLLFVTEWRTALLNRLRNINLSDRNGENLIGVSDDANTFADATLAIFTVLEKCDIETPSEIAHLTHLVSALREGPDELSNYFYN